MEDFEVVHLKVDPSSSQGHGRRSTLCETLLGFIPGHFLPGDSRIMVAGIVPDGALVRMGGGLQVGDWVVSLNDLDVSHDNIDALLSAVTRPRKIKLTIQPLNKRSQSSLASLQHQRSNSTVSSTSSSHSLSSSLLRPLGSSPSDASSYTNDLEHIPHVVMYLTTEIPPTKSGSREDLHSKSDDVIYTYPKKTKENKIAELRGLFETLPQLLVDVTDNVVKSSTLIVDAETLHVSYIRCEPEVLVFGASAKLVSAQYLNDLIRDLSRLLLVIYGSLQSAFKDPVNQRQMDQFLKVFLGQVLAKKTSFQHTNLLNSVENKLVCRMTEAVKWMPLNHSIRSLISSTLSNYESADFAELSDDFYDIRRQYTIVGTTLFYKGYLIGSHLPKEDLLDISLYLKYTSLLQISADQATTDQIVVWREAYPTRRYHDPSGDAPVLGYSEPVDARWFLLVVGMKKLLLTALLEAGGCSQWAEGNAVSPNSFYVDQARACLLQLESLDIPGSCEMALSQYLPSTALADVFIANVDEQMKKANSSPLISTSRSLLSNRGTSISSLKNELDSISIASSGGEIRRTGSINSIESGDSSVSSTTMPHHEKLKGKTSSRFMPTLEQLSRKSSNLSEEDNNGNRNISTHFNCQIQLSAGAENSIFHYLYFQGTEGVFVIPNDYSHHHTQLNSLNAATFHDEIVHNFYTSVITIQKTFEQTLSSEELKDSNYHKDLGRFATSTVQHHQRVYEEGVLFHFTPTESNASKKGNNNHCPLTYWVIGRMFLEPEPQQIYICFQDGVSQNLVETAFKLGFGIGI